MSIVDDFRAIREAVDKKPLPDNSDPDFDTFKIKMKKGLCCYVTNRSTGEISVTNIEYLGAVPGWEPCDERGLIIPPPANAGKMTWSVKIRSHTQQAQQATPDTPQAQDAQQTSP